MNQVYESFATTVLAEMKDILKHREVHITDEINNKKGQAKKPWWTAELTTLWNGLCKAKKYISQPNGQARKVNRGIFKKGVKFLIKQFNVKN